MSSCSRYTQEKTSLKLQDDSQSASVFRNLQLETSYSINYAMLPQHQLFFVLHLSRKTKRDANCCHMLFQTVLDLLVQLQLQATYMQGSTVPSDSSFHDQLRGPHLKPEQVVHDAVSTSTAAARLYSNTVHSHRHTKSVVVIARLQFKLRKVY
jgi:hypothetical protein